MSSGKDIDAFEVGRKDASVLTVEALLNCSLSQEK